VKPFVFLKDNEALVLKATRPFVDKRDGGKERFVEDEYLFKGPGTYIPRVEEEVKSRIEAIIVLPNHALLLRAKRDTVDALDEKRKAGETVSIKFLGNPFEIVVTSQNWLLHAHS
jgi:major vault protein